MEDASRIVIEARGLVKNYSDQQVIKKISFQVEEGECFGLLGPNGAGKSTTMRMLSCTSPANEGDLYILGLDARNQANRIQHQIGIVPQDDGLDPDFSALDNLIIYAGYFGIDKKEAKRRALDLLRIMRLEEDRNKSVVEMSIGQRRRLALARGLINEPSLLLLDEPTTGLDPNIRLFMWEYLEELKLKGRSLLLTTHYMEEAERLCDRVAIVDDGKILGIGTPQEMIDYHVGFEVVEFQCRSADVNYYLAKFKQDFEYQVLKNRIRLFVKDGQDTKSIIGGIDSDSITLRKASLEDVFLKLAGYDLDH